MGKFRRRQRLKSMVKGNKSRKKGRGGVREEQVRSLVLTAQEWEEGAKLANGRRSSRRTISPRNCDYCSRVR